MKSLTWIRKYIKIKGSKAKREVRIQILISDFNFVVANVPQTNEMRGILPTF